VALKQFENDQKLVDLVTAMKDMYEFVSDLESLPYKMRQLEGTIIKVLEQTVECSIFIREYTGHGFAGTVIYYMPNLFFLWFV
jgi:hypothetical protein